MPLKYSLANSLNSYSYNNVWHLKTIPVVLRSQYSPEIAPDNLAALTHLIKTCSIYLYTILYYTLQLISILVICNYLKNI